MDSKFMKLYKQVTPQTEEQIVNISFVVINFIKSLILKNPLK